MVLWEKSRISLRPDVLRGSGSHEVGRMRDFCKAVRRPWFGKEGESLGCTTVPGTISRDIFRQFLHFWEHENHFKLVEMAKVRSITEYSKSALLQRGGWSGDSESSFVAAVCLLYCLGGEGRCGAPYRENFEMRVIRSFQMTGFGKSHLPCNTPM